MTPRAIPPSGAFTPRVERKRNRRVQEILRATAVLVGERGHAAVSLDDVAEALDVTKGSIYYYFPSKDELISACIESIGTEVNQRLAAVADDAVGSVIERLRALIREQLLIVLRDRPESVQLFLLPVEWPEPQRSLARRMREEHNLVFKRLIQEGVRGSELRVTTIDMTLHCLHGALNYVPVWCRPARGKELDRVIGEVTETVLALVGHRVDEVATSS